MDFIRFDQLPHARKGIFVDIPKGAQGAGRWTIQPEGRKPKVRYVIKLNGTLRKECADEAAAKGFVAFETNRVIA